ncbi:MAG TPA: amino acid adenylation domain-containing protein, partial [Longimicrobiaceae bacterium]|nr:amino acid adenylation domain-containing protein [Longimicrobiaceae bacterium]
PAREDAPAIPCDAAGPALEGSGAGVAVALGEEETRALLRDAPAAYRTQVNDLLLAAVVRAVGHWTGEPRVLVELESHGREEVVEGAELSLSRTVGWLTATYPLLLDLRGAEGEAAAIKAVKERLRSVPARGIGYGLLRWMGPEEVHRRLAELPRTRVSFNYLGQVDGTFSGGGAFRVAGEATGPARSPRGERPYLLELTSVVEGGRLHLQVGYSRDLHREETVRRLAGNVLDELRTLVAHCVSPGAGGYTPSDFPLAALGQAELDELLGRERGVEDVYPLTPMQEGMLFHSLLDPGGGAYVGQFVYDLVGELDPDVLWRAWQATVQRHAALRTGFAWQGGDRPLQVVRREVEIPVRGEDWRGLSAADREARLDAFLAADRERGFDPARPPLMRLALFRTGDRRHRLVWTHHHLLLDGWSLPLVFREVAVHYDALSGGREVAVAPERPYRDYVAWLGRQDRGAAERFWREQLAGVEAPTPFGIDRAVPTREPGFVHLRSRLSPELSGRLGELARRSGLTLGTLVQGAWALILSRCSGCREVVFGSTVSGRAEEVEGVEEMVGLFINTLPVRVPVPADTPVLPWLRDLQELNARLREYGYSPLAEVQRWSGVEGAPLFESILVFENYPVEDALAGMGERRFEVETVAGVEQTDYPLTLSMGPAGPEDGLALRATFARGRFETDAVERLLGFFHRVLEAFADDPGRPLGDVALLTDREREWVVNGEWNATGQDYPAGLIHEMVAAQAARTPEAVAVRFRGETTSYAELERRANRLAHHLRALGVGPEVRVGVCLERTPELVVALLAVLKAGGAYVPLDPAYPGERLAYLVEDSGAPVVVARVELAGRLPQREVRVVAVDAERDRIAARPGTAPESGAVPENLAYVIYTSGSTGRPKGVMARHSSVAVLLHWLRETVSDEERSSVLSCNSVSFDASVLELFGTLCWGGKVVLVENALELAGLSEPVVYAAMVPTAAAELLRMGAIPASVRTLCLGGEPLPADLARELYALGTVERVTNVYGPTEDTIGSTYSLVERGADRIRIGRPLANTRAYVLDGELRPAPVGVAGELFLAGAGLARGYLGRPELTAERFLPDPFGEPGRRMYRTMDRARWTPEGELEHLGRTDTQVKVRGFRIEPGEVEAALRAHPRVGEAVVVARGDAPGGRRLVAYLVPAEGAEPPGAAELYAHLRERLPEHMVPASFVALDALPLTSSGKLDRRALPAPQRNGGAPGEYVAPRTPAEELLAGIVAEVLQVERVGVHDNFFDLGGHSLLATRVVSRVRRQMGVEMELRTLFEAPSVAELAGRLTGQQPSAEEHPFLHGGERLGGDPPPAVELRPLPRDGGPLPLSFAQQRLWFVDQLQPGRAAYNIPAPIRVHGALDVSALERALAAIVRRHESLRTRFPAPEGAPVQRVDPPRPVHLPVADLGRLDAEAREAETRRLARREARRPFDLAAGPLLRATVLRLGEDDTVVLFTMHHVVSDGWSMEIFIRELSALYGGFSHGEEVRLPPLPVQYADYAVWQRSWLSGEVLERETEYWRSRLSGAPALLELPTDRPRPRVAGDAGGTCGFGIGPEVAAGLRALGRVEGATPFMTLLSAWQLLLGRYAWQDDVVVGTPIAGRNRLETEGVIGLFVNTLVSRASLASDPTFRELLGQVREATLGAYQHQELPFEKLVEELGVERSLAYTPLVQVLFTLQNNRRGELRLGGSAVEPLGGGAGSVKFDLNLSVTEAGDGFRCELAYRSELWDDGSAARMLEHYGRVLEEVAARPERRVSEVSLVSAAGQAQLLAASAASERAYPDLCVHELFEIQAARSPEAVALVLDGESLSYGELDRRANRLARHLRTRGAGVEAHVALSLERSFEMVVGVLAILKAGGVHVPLDPAYPAERLAYQLEDSGAALLVTTTALLERLGPTPVGTVLLDAHHARIARESDAPLRGGATPENLAYVTYTSGSTGRPKGVMTRHAGVVSYLSVLAEEYGLAPDDVVLQLATLSFDASVRDLIGPLSVGARVVLVRSREVADPARLVRLAREHHVSAILAIVPSLLRPLLAAAEEAGPAPLRLLLVSGEPLAIADCQRARRAFGGSVRVVNLWGATECTMSSTFHTVREEEGAGTAALGVPIANTRIYVLDAEMRPVPPGVAGEAYIAGAGVARGYRNRPELTAERFLPDPFGTVPGARLYRVGDVVRRRPDGVLEFLGRTDQQVKIRGIRVETGEVEAVLRAHPRVREAAVVAREVAPGETGLVAYVACEGGALDTGALRSSLERTLPAHMVPSVFVPLERFPLLPNGKVDRAALPEPHAGARPDGAGYVAPVTGTERTLAGIWESLLGVRPIGLDDDFFRLGGHSLLAVRLTAQIRSRFGTEVPLSALFEHPTVRGLAAWIGRGLRPEPSSPLVAIQPHGDRVPLFFVHPVGGQVLCYTDLARELGPDQPFYGLQASDPAQLGEEASIEEMAASYVSAVRTVRPGGPYLLGGWSFGGFVAFEMAQQLTRAGESVALVAMLDTRPPGPACRPADLDECVHLVSVARAEARMAGKRFPLTADDLRPLDPDARIARVLELLREQDVLPPDVEESWIRGFFRGTRVRMRSVFHYEPKPYPGRIILFVPDGSDADPELLSLRHDTSAPGWAAYTAQPLLKLVVSGSHGTMATGEHAAGLARQLRALIDASLSP